MKPLKKYSTFDELKSTESKSKDLTKSLEKHNKFKKFIKAISMKKKKGATLSIPQTTNGR